MKMSFSNEHGPWESNNNNNVRIIIKGINTFVFILYFVEFFIEFNLREVIFQVIPMK